MDIEKLFGSGYSTGRIPLVIGNVILQLLDKERWVKDLAIGFSIPEWSFVDFDPELPVDERELLISDTLALKTPKHYKHLLMSWIMSSEDFVDLAKLGQINIVGLSIWDGVEDLSWHWDGYDAGDFILMSYFSPYDEWPSDWQGMLTTGTRRLDGDWLGFSKDSQVYAHEVIYPEHCRFVLLNNQNPKFVHRTTLLDRVDIHRYTISASVKIGSK